jgi:hypothetical protein
MLCRKLIGISFTPDALSIMSIAVGLRSPGPPTFWSVPLGPDCIDPSSGALVCPDLLIAQLRLAPPTLGLAAASSQIGLALPGQLFLTETWPAELPPHGLDRGVVLAEALRRLPGDRTALQIDCHLASSAGRQGAISAMVVAIRRASLDQYLTTLGRCDIHPESAVSSEIARFNSLCLAQPTAVSSRVLCVTVRSSVVESELWEHGVLECKQREPVDGDIHSLVGRLSQLDIVASRRDINREAPTFDCIGIFGDALQVSTIVRGLPKAASESVTGGRFICPVERIFGISDADCRGCMNEAAGAIALQLVGRSRRPRRGAGIGRC